MVCVLQVNQIRFSLLKSHPPKLMIEADGLVGTPGWTDLKLVPLEKKLSADGILDLNFVGTPPKDIVPQVISPVTAHIIVEDEIDNIIGVLVHARTNKLLRLIDQDNGAQNAAQEQQAQYAQQVQFDPGSFGKSPDFTTFAIGEGIGDHLPPIKTLALGEEGKSPFTGEEGKSPFKGEEGKSPFTGEEGKSPFKGEEGKSPFTGEEGTTLRLGEEGKTPFSGEEGTTLRFGEEGNTHFFGEGGKSPVFGEETDALGGESGPVGLETDIGLEDGRSDFGENSVVGEDFQDVFSDRIRSPFNRR